MAEQTDVLAQPLPEPTLPPKEGRVGFKEAIGIQSPFLARKSAIQSELNKAEADIAKGQQEQKEIKSTGELSAQMRFGQEQQAAMQGYQEKLQKEPLPAFIPSKDNAQDIAGLFGVISVLSMLVGGSGRMSGQLALGNMNGMMEGYRKGRKDLYERERSEFDKNFKAMMQKHVEFRQEMEDAIKLAVTNKEEGFRAAELAAVKAGSPIVMAQLRKGDLLGAYKLIDESQKGYESALKMEQRARAEEARAKEAADRAREAAAARIQAARESAQAKIEAAREKAEAKTSKVTQQQFIVQRSVNALGGVASAVESLNQLPAGTTAGILPNLQTKDGMFNYIRNAAGRTMSKSEEKAVETLFTGITRNLAAIEASGAATGLTGLSTQLEKLRPVAGDKAIDVALKMADIRRIATENIQPLIDSGLMPKQQADTASLLIKRIEKAIPYTTDEVVKALSSGKGKETMGEAGARMVAPKPAEKYEDPEKEARYQKWLKENPQ